MPLVLDVTIGGPNSNSYGTVAEADTYFEAQLRATDWTGASAGDKAIALVMATRLLDEWVEWKGKKVGLATEQALRNPRYNLQDRDGQWVDHTTLDVKLKEATYELGKDLLASDILADPETRGIAAASMAGLGSVAFDKMDRDNESVIAERILAMIEHLGSIRRKGGGGAKKLARV